MMIRIALPFVLAAAPILAVGGTGIHEEFSSRRVVRVSDYVRIGPVSGGGSEGRARTLEKRELSRLAVYFLRDSLKAGDGIQFVRITVTVTAADGSTHDRLVERAFTFPRAADPEDENRLLRDYARIIHPLGFVSRRRIDTVEVELPDLPDWARVEVRVEPDDEYAAYAHERGNSTEWHYRARGSRFDGAFYLGIPKVLYDSRDRDGLDYGRTSANYRLFWLDAETGERFPVNVGFGSYGVRTPIDVSSAGGGFAFSALLDVFEVGRRFGLRITEKVNAGIEVVPFFPVNHPPRVLLALRVGIAP